MCKAQGVLLLALFVRLAHSWDIVATAGDRLEFYTNDGDKISTVHLYSRNLKAITYDEVHNLLLYVDIQRNNDAICAYNITSSKEHKCYIEWSGRNIQDMAFDPVTEALFFTDTKERSINWFSLKPGSKNNVNGNLLIKIDDGIPTEIVVDSCRGYIYWINTNRTPSNIERAKLNGLERKVVLEAVSTWQLHSLTIDHQTHKLYYKVYGSSISAYIDSYDFVGNNSKHEYELFHPSGKTIVHPNSLKVSKQFILAVCTSCTEREINSYSKPLENNEHLEYLNDILIDTTSSVGVTTNDKIKDQLAGILECNQVLHDYETTFCAHGIKWTLNGQSLCKCTPGYTGERCEVSVCESTNCFQGNCSITKEGLATCRCNAGYSGDRCEVNVCHGYCMQGNCSFNEEGLPECRCNAGYSGERCEVNVCHGYCWNNGSCSLNEQSEPICQCERDFVGPRCEISDCLNYCMQGNCSFNEEGLPECRCNSGYSGERCEINVCHQYCLNNGICSLNEEDEPVCECTAGYDGKRCDVPLNLNNAMRACPCDTNQESSRLKADTKKTISSNSNYYVAGRNLTLADLLANWRKPVATINVFVEVKPN